MLLQVTGSVDSIHAIEAGRSLARLSSLGKFPKKGERSWHKVYIQNMTDFFWNLASKKFSDDLHPTHTTFFSPYNPTLLQTRVCKKRPKSRPFILKPLYTVSPARLVTSRYIFVFVLDAVNTANKTKTRVQKFSTLGFPEGPKRFNVEKKK